jgi:hypothetical protein
MPGCPQFGRHRGRNGRSADIDIRPGKDLTSGRRQPEFIHGRTEHRRNLGLHVRPDDSRKVCIHGKRAQPAFGFPVLRQYGAFVGCHVVECPTRGVLRCRAGHVAQVCRSLNSCSECRHDPDDGIGPKCRSRRLQAWNGWRLCGCGCHPRQYRKGKRKKISHDLSPSRSSSSIH